MIKTPYTHIYKTKLANPSSYQRKGTKNHLVALLFKSIQKNMKEAEFSKPFA